MKKEVKVEYGIQIVKPWSTEMYDHNDEVAEIVREKVENMIHAELAVLEESLDSFDEGNDLALHDLDWECASPRLVELQKAVTCYGFGFGYTIESVMERVADELESAPTYRLKEMAEELDIKLVKGFVGFN